MTSGAINDENAGIQFRRNRQSTDTRRKKPDTRRKKPDTIRRNEHTIIIKEGRKEKKKKTPEGGGSLGRDICYFIKKDAEITSPYICLTIVSPCII